MGIVMLAVSLLLLCSCDATNLRGKDRKGVSDQTLLLQGILWGAALTTLALGQVENSVLLSTSSIMIGIIGLWSYMVNGPELRPVYSYGIVRFLVGAPGFVFYALFFFIFGVVMAALSLGDSIIGTPPSRKHNLRDAWTVLTWCTGVALLSLVAVFCFPLRDSMQIQPN